VLVDVSIVGHQSRSTQSLVCLAVLDLGDAVELFRDA
jgi:hypothetical protein